MVTNTLPTITTTTIRTIASRTTTALLASPRNPQNHHNTTAQHTTTPRAHHHRKLHSQHTAPLHNHNAQRTTIPTSHHYRIAQKTIDRHNLQLHLPWNKSKSEIKEKKTYDKRARRSAIPIISPPRSCHNRVMTQLSDAMSNGHSPLCTAMAHENCAVKTSTESGEGGEGKVRVV